MSDERENVFGPDRDGEPGIHPAPGVNPPQMTDIVFESSAMHSRSKCWLPFVVMRVMAEDGIGIAVSIPVDVIAELITNLRDTGRRARQDISVGIQKGQLPCQHNPNQP